MTNDYAHTIMHNRRMKELEAYAEQQRLAAAIKAESKVKTPRNHNSFRLLDFIPRRFRSDQKSFNPGTAIRTR